jgi:hypothetical protein
VRKLLRFVAVLLLRNCGSWDKPSTMLPGSILPSSKAVTAVTGVGVCMPERTIREPVTVISSGRSPPASCPRISPAASSDAADNAAAETTLLLSLART